VLAHCSETYTNIICLIDLHSIYFDLVSSKIVDGDVQNLMINDEEVEYE